MMITRCRLPLDCTRHRAVSFVSHAHRDHIAPHHLALCSAETSRLYQHRLGQRSTSVIPYQNPFPWGDMQLTIYPAGHCLGSAMLLAEYENQSILYTADFKLNDCHTCQKIEIPQAKTLIIESTFADPKFHFPPFDVASEQLIGAVRQGFQNNKTPIVTAYSLGKAQVVTKILAAAGFQLVVSPDIFAINQIYQEFNIELGNYVSVNSPTTSDCVLITSPKCMNFNSSNGDSSFWKIAVTGWALDQQAVSRMKVDRAIALSDHADFQQLLQTVEQVNPEMVYCTHGPKQHILNFVAILKEKGLNAAALPRMRQKE